jgi:elongation factor Ts
MSKISALTVKELREKTGAGLLNCKKALEDNGGDIEKASESLRKKGLASADKKSDRQVNEGIIETYIHTGGRLGVMVELNCETDFVARRIEFQELAKNIAMQIAASTDVKYVSIEDIPEEFIAKEKEIELGKEDLKNKPEEIREKIVEGRINKILKNYSLKDQDYIRDSNLTIENLIKEKIALLGENIQVARFTRFMLGETS